MFDLPETNKVHDDNLFMISYLFFLNGIEQNKKYSTRKNLNVVMYKTHETIFCTYTCYLSSCDMCHLISQDTCHL